MIDLLRTDVRHALRWLRKSPAFTLVAVASLAAGIGFNTAVFAVADAVLFRPLPVAQPDRLVDVFTSGSGGAAAQPFSTSSYPDYLDLRAKNDVFEDIVGYSPMFGPLNLGDRSQLVLGEIVTGNYFRTLGVGAALGRTIVPDDDRAGAARVAMVSYRSWVRDFGSSPDAVGRTLKLRGDVYTIVGVAPRGFTGMTPILAPEVWVPATASLTVEPVGLHDVVPSPIGTTRLERRGDRWLFMRGRLKPGASVDQAGANLALVLSQIDAANPATNTDRRIAVKATSDVHLHPAADREVVPIAGVLMVIVGLVLLIACANVASMLLARASGRQKEIAVRLAIGASRRQIARQLVTESLVLSSIGALFGLLLAWWILNVVASLTLPTPIPFAFDLRIDGRVLLFTIGATFAAGLLAGMVPALKATKVTLTSDLRGDLVIRPMGGWRWSLRDMLVAGQMATTAVLLVVAALLTRSLIAAEHTDVGFAVDRLALVSTDTNMLRYSPDRSLQFYNQALDRVRAIPGVESAALATRVPFSVNVNRWDDIWIPGHHQPGQPGDTIDVTRVSSDYFKTVGVAIVQGRAFTDDDRPTTPRVAVVNETFARRYWPRDSAIGKTFQTRGGAGPVYVIVGVSADHKVSTVAEAPTPFIHVARSQQPNAYTAIIARTGGDANALLRDMRRELLALEPNLVFFENQTMEAEMSATLFPARAEALVVGTVGVVAMLLAAIGLYGVIAYSVSRRTREIGIRMALGASASTVLRLVMRQGLIVAVAGLGVGFAAGCIAAALARSEISGMLYGVSLADPLSWGIAAAVLLSASTLANFIPAWRAARVQPSQALRIE